MTLIPHWKRAWRLLSVQAMTIALAVQATWLSLPEDLRTDVPPWLAAGTTALLLVAGLVGRLIRQEPPDGTD